MIPKTNKSAERLLKYIAKKKPINIVHSFPNTTPPLEQWHQIVAETTALYPTMKAMKANLHTDARPVQQEFPFAIDHQLTPSPSIPWWTQS